MGELTQTQWPQVTESENGHLDFQFDSSLSGTKKCRTVINQLTSFTLFNIFKTSVPMRGSRAKKFTNPICAAVISAALCRAFMTSRLEP